MQTQLLDSERSRPRSGRREDTIDRSLSPTASRAPAVTAGLNYLVPMAEHPYTYMYEPPAGQAWQNCEYRESSARIADARACASPPTIEVEGFTLRDAPTAVSDFRDERAVRSRYYAETAELAKYVTGADHADIFDHLVRQREPGRPRLEFGRKIASRPGAAGRVHNDYSEASGRGRFDLVVSDHPRAADVRRWAIVNIWRSIRAKVEDTPLALCDARTISAADLVATELRYPDRTGETYLVQHGVPHRWAYFSEMDRHEALVFKQDDSQMSGVARFTPHCAFDLPEIAADAPLRESIEVRCLVTYS